MTLFDTLFNIKTGGPRVANLKSHSGTFTERFDSNKLAFILNNLDTVKKLYRPDPRDSLLLDKYYLAGPSGSVRVTYTQNYAKTLRGRYQAKGSLSGQAMVREVRYSIFQDYYIDLDIDNAHPVITVWLCRNLGIPCEMLSEYVTNREELIREIIDLNPELTREDVKRLFLSINYGGRSSYSQIKKSSEFLVGYNAESAGIKAAVCEKLKYFKLHSDKTRNAKGKDYNLDGAAMSHICCFVENQLLQIILEYLKAKIDISECILCFDGIMIRRELYNPLYIEELELIFSNLDIPIKLSEKNMTSLDLGGLGYDADEEYIFEGGTVDTESTVSSSSEKKEPPFVILKNLFLENVDGKYARMCNSSYIYSRVNKCFYKPLTDELQQFMNDIWGKYSLYKDSNMKTRNELRSFIREVVDDRFPFIKHDANLICFRNGVYDLSIAKLVPFEKVKTAVQARTYIDKDFEYQMDTPLLDSILKYQFTEDGVLDTETYTDVMEFLYICLGRLMTKVQDNYGFMLMLYGASNCGKSVFMELLKATFNVKTQVGILGSNKQAIFGLQDFYDKDLMICDDIKDMSKTLEKSLFLSMMTNGSVNVPIKNRESKAIDRWDIPLLICSNHMLNYKEESNEISRRLCIFEFPRIVDSECTDLGLVDEIKNTEICGFIHKCRSKYLEFYAKNKRTAIWNHYPEYIKRTLTDEYKSQNNNTYMFVRDRVEYAEGESVPSMEMNREFKSFVKTKYDLQRMPREALNRSSVYGFDPRIVFKSEMICKSCDCPHKAGCCSAYNRTNRTRTEFWYNCRLKY